MSTRGSGWSVPGVSTWTSVHLHPGATIAAVVHLDGDRAVVELGADSLRTVVSLFAGRAELEELHTVIGRAVAELDAHTPSTRITAAGEKDLAPAA